MARVGANGPGILRGHSGPRLYLDPPSVGEAPSSWLDRAAQTYRCSREGLLRLYGLEASVRADWDLACCWTATNPIVQACKFPSHVVRKLATQPADRAWLLESNVRLAYCPKCFVEDLGQEQAPYFRMDWARIFLTHCRVHQSPLFLWPTVGSKINRVLPKEWITSPIKGGEKTAPWMMRALMDTESFLLRMEEQPMARSIWQLLLRFEAACSSFVRVGSDRVNVSRYRGLASQLMMFALKKVDVAGQRKSISDFIDLSRLHSVIFNFHRPPGLRDSPNDPWAAVIRRLTCPASRRVVMTLVAKLFVELYPCLPGKRGTYRCSGYSDLWLATLGDQIGSRERVLKAWRESGSTMFIQALSKQANQSPPRQLHWVVAPQVAKPKRLDIGVFSDVRTHIF